MASPLHVDPALYSIDIAKTPGVDSPNTDVIGIDTGGFGTSDIHNTEFPDIGWKTPPTPGVASRSDVTDDDSTREDTPGIDIANLSKTPVGTTFKTARTEDRLNLKLALKPATTATGLVQSYALVNAKMELDMSAAEWLRFQQEISRFLDQGEWLYESYEEAAYAFLEGTDANERFFGILPGAEAEGMLINRGGLAWGLDNDAIIALVATVIAAWKEAPSQSKGDFDEECLPPVEKQDHVRQTDTKPQFKPQVIAMLPKDILEECMALLPANSGEKNIDSSDGDEEDPVLFVCQHHTSAKRKRQVIESGEDEGDEEDEDEHDGEKDYGEPQPTSKRNMRRRVMIKTRTKPFAAGTTMSTCDAGPQLFINRAWPNIIADNYSGQQMWANPKPSPPAPWMPSTLHIHGIQRGPMKLLAFRSIMTLEELLFQFRNAFNKELSNSAITKKCQTVRRIRIYHKLLFDSNGLRIEGDDAHLWKATMEKLRKKVADKEFGRLSGSVEIHF